MLTRCPSCATAFRITQAQLDARQGMVRCGRCGNAFNAVDCAVEGQDIPAATEAANQAASAPPEPPTPAATPEPAEWIPADLAAPSGEAGSRAAGSHFVASSTVERAMASEVAGEHAAAPPQPPAPMVEATSSAAPAIEAAPPAAEDEEAGGQAQGDALEERPIAAILAGPPKVRHRLPRSWAFGVLAMLLLALAQIAYIFRDELASGMPWTKPYLGAFCGLVGCRIELLRLPELMDIEYSDLQPEPGRRDRLMLRATVRNRALVTQAFPHIELTLTDHRDHALARRVLPPADYLPAGADPAAGVEANGEIHVALPLDVAGVGASGYRLYVFYP
jgi:predicted Zn finger-like uncharacterized protein